MRDVPLYGAPSVLCCGPCVPPGNRYDSSRHPPAASCPAHGRPRRRHTRSVPVGWPPGSAGYPWLHSGHFCDPAENVRSSVDLSMRHFTKPAPDPLPQSSSTTGPAPASPNSSSVIGSLSVAANSSDRSSRHGHAARASGSKRESSPECSGTSCLHFAAEEFGAFPELRGEGLR